MTSVNRISYSAALLVVSFCYLLIVQGQDNDYKITGRSGFHVIGGHEYYINNESTMAWMAASDLCNYMNMKLVSLDTEEKYLAIKKYVEANCSVVAFFASGRWIEDTWYWTGLGQRLIFADWGPKEPNYMNVLNETCLVLYKSNVTPIYNLGNQNCENHFNVICE